MRIKLKNKTKQNFTYPKLEITTNRDIIELTCSILEQVLALVVKRGYWDSSSPPG
jgi:hypothetical protein